MSSNQMKIFENNITKINNIEIQNKEYKGQRVVTFEDIDTVHRRASGTAGRNFRANRDKFIVGEDYFEIPSDEIRRIGLLELTDNVHRPMLFFTEQGYLMLVKSLMDDLAWEVQRKLVKSYFREKNRYASVVPKNYIEALELALEQAKTIEIQQLQLEEQKPLVTLSNNFLQSKDSVDIGTMAKILKDYDLDIGRNRLFEFLRKQKMLMNNNLPYQKYLEQGYFEVIEVAQDTISGVKIFPKTLVTPKGQLFITNFVRENYYNVGK